MTKYPIAASSIASLCAVLFGVGVIGSSLMHADTPAATTQPAAVDPKPVNTKCPVSGDDIDPKITEVYNGKTYAFCCADCVKAFNKDPEKYASKAK